MSWIDIGVLVVIALAVYDGSRSGFWWAFLEALVLTGSAVIAKLVRPHAEPYVFKIVDLDAWDLPWVTHLALFVLTACSLFGLLMLVHPATKKWRFRNDRWFGAFVGLLNGVVASLLVVGLATGARNVALEAELRSSRMVAATGAAAEAAPMFFPDHVARRAAWFRPK